jgi:hypothetical protein
MRVLISGASGLLGAALTRALRSEGHHTVALVRRAAHDGEMPWDPRQPLDPAKLSSCDALVHLAGKNIAGRWTEKFKQEVLESRRTGQPRAFVSASGVGYYGSRGDEILTEGNAAGTGFLAEVCKRWEAATDPARDADVRVVNLRIGVVLAQDGGALKPMLLPFRLGLGGRVGTGRQWWSWVSLDDVIGAMLFALGNTLHGAVNVVGPAPVRSADFVKALGKALHRPTIFPLPKFVIRGVMGEMGEELLLTSARAVPETLQSAGYKFRHTNLEDALLAALR